MMPTVLVPVVEVGCGTRTVVLRDVKTGARVRVEGIETCRLVGRVVCLELPLAEPPEGETVRVELPDGGRMWVRRLPVERGNAA